MKYSFVFVCSLFLAGCVAPTSPYTQHMTTAEPIARSTEINLSIPSNESISFRGLVNYDDVQGGNYNGFYPGGSGAVMVAAIVAHSIAAESAKNGQKTKLQAEADKTLAPYQSTINEIDSNYLLYRLEQQIPALAQNPHPKESPSVSLKSTPTFLLSSDEKTLILQHKLVAYAEEDTDHTRPLYQNMIEVYALTINTEDPHRYWTSDEKENLKSLAKELYTESITLGISDMQQRLTSQGPQKTFSYYHTKKRHYERGTLIREGEDRVAIRTLRGWIKSIPKIDSEHT